MESIILYITAAVAGVGLGLLWVRVDLPARYRARVARREAERLAGWCRWYGTDYSTATDISWQYVAEAMARPGSVAPDRENPWIKALGGHPVPRNHRHAEPPARVR